MKLKRTAARLPAVLIYATALTCGVLSAIALQIQLAGAGLSLAPLWDSIFSGRALDLRTTGPWWAIAGISFLISGVTAAALSRVSFPWRRWRSVRWILGATVVLLLAHIGHGSASLPRFDAAAHTVAALAALVMAGILALCGAYFTVQR
jgi:hypothetical protein